MYSELDDSLDKMIRRIFLRGNMPNTHLVRKAYEIAKKCHQGVKRKSGDPYLTHPLEVAIILEEMGLESDIIVAALLHDVVEDSDYTIEQIKEEFNESIAMIVDAVTEVKADVNKAEKLTIHELDKLTDAKLINIGKENMTAFYIKLADRLHNLHTISCMSHEKQLKKVEHTRDILLPIAKKLNVNVLYEKIEDACFYIHNGKEYEKIKDSYRNLLQINSFGIKETIGVLKDTFVPEYSKMHNKHNDVKENVVTVVETELLPYQLYAQVFEYEESNKVKELERISKYNISLYKIYVLFENQNSSTELLNFVLKTYKRVLKRKSIVIIDIKENNSGGVEYMTIQDQYKNKYQLFFRTMQEHVMERNGSLEGVNFPSVDENTVVDGLEEQIIVQKKDGTTMLLPKGATVLDFAFKLHDNFGLCAKYAFINNSPSRQPLYTKLNNGDRVEVVASTDREKGITKIHAEIRWLMYVNTINAKRKIVKYLENKYHENV